MPKLGNTVCFKVLDPPHGLEKLAEAITQLIQEQTPDNSHWWEKQTIHALCSGTRRSGGNFFIH